MSRVRVLRATVIQGAIRNVGEILDVTSRDMMYLGRRVEVVRPEEIVVEEPERTVETTAEHASLIGQSRTSRRR